MAIEAYIRQQILVNIYLLIMTSGLPTVTEIPYFVRILATKYGNTKCCLWVRISEFSNKNI